jgi:hypothetical protein
VLIGQQQDQIAKMQAILDAMNAAKTSQVQSAPTAGDTLQ